MSIARMHPRCCEVPACGRRSARARVQRVRRTPHTSRPCCVISQPPRSRVVHHPVMISATTFSGRDDRI